MMDTAILLAFLYALYAVPALVGFAIHWLLIRKRLPLLWPSWIILFVPWSIWIGLVSFKQSGKSESNIVEPNWLGMLVAVVLVVQAIVSRIKPQQHFRTSVGALLMCCLAAVAIWAFVPALPV